MHGFRHRGAPDTRCDRRADIAVACQARSAGIDRDDTRSVRMSDVVELFLAATVRTATPLALAAIGFFHDDAMAVRLGCAPEWKLDYTIVCSTHNHSTPT